ncbi:DUF222 domain-containing protein [Kribbella sp. NPDC050281]|uniref:HNH endonuclease signature motif containing protein n=1 Tax=Kribbella sp. NPDC050281 TaxID=3155515 RepID=UPI0033C8575D
MELLGERPIWSMSGSEMLTALDQLEADLARRQTYRLQLIAALDTTGHAADLGAHDTAQLLAFRYRLDRPTAYRDVRLARALPKYPTVITALTAPVDNVASNAESESESECDDDSANGLTEPETATADAEETADADAVEGEGASEGEGDDASAGECVGQGAGDGAGEGGGEGAGAGGEDRTTAWLLRPAQAEAIVSALERVPTAVPVENLQVAEQQMVALARHLTPSELRKAAKQIRDLLDTDGPEPGEHKAYARESLALITAENGVKFRGYLANENAELLRTLIHTGARPHKTLDGELDPRPREKRQADALTTALTLAATATDSSLTPPAAPAPARSTTPTTGNPNPTDLSGNPGATSTHEPGIATPTPEPPDAIPVPRRSTGTESGIATPTPASTDPASVSPGCAASAIDTGSTAVPGIAITAATVAGTSAGATTGTGRAAKPPGGVPGLGAKANITVTIDLEDLKSAAADATGGLVYGDNLSAAAIRRLACDANIIPLVLGSNSEPLDVGRSERLVTRAMRRALNARDKGCVVCGAPPTQCDAHHLRSWLDGGVTAIWNLVLLCRRHHIDLHAGHWTITITNGVVHVTRPTWADPIAAPDPRQREPVPPSSSTRARSAAPPNPQIKPFREHLSGDGPSIDPWSGELRSGEVRPDELRSDELPFDAPQSDGLWSDAVRSDAVRSDRHPLDATRSDDAARMDSTQSREGREGDASGVTTRSGNRRTDAAALREAARQAIWGDTSTSESDVHTVLPGTPALSAEAAHHDPWADPVPPAPVRPRGT